MNRQLAELLDGLINRIDTFVEVSKRNHCLTRNPEWTRLECLEKHFSNYDDKVIEAVYVLLSHKMQVPYEPLDLDYYYIEPKL